MVYQAKNNVLTAKKLKNAIFCTFQINFPQKTSFDQKFDLAKGVYLANI